MRAVLESLLRARKLDVTLAPFAPDGEPIDPARVAPTGDPALDAALGGGLRRGHLSDLTGAPSSGRTTIAVQAIAAATARGEAAALVDAGDTFDPASAAAHGVELSHLLWVRPTPRLGAGGRDVMVALKAYSLVLQAGGFGLAILDLADAEPAALRLPATTWMRLARIVEGSDTVALLIGTDRLARSAGGATIACETVVARWQGTAHRARVFTGVTAAPRVVGGRRMEDGGRKDDASERVGGSGAKPPNWKEDGSRKDDANERQRVSHASGAGFGVPASERVGGSGAKPPDWK